MGLKQNMTETTLMKVVKKYRSDLVELEQEKGKNYPYCVETAIIEKIDNLRDALEMYELQAKACGLDLDG